MIYQSPKNPNVHHTAIDREKPSYPTRQLLSRRLIKGRILDFGCGNGIDVDFLHQKGFDVTGYDPFFASELPTGKFDTILCNYVLNVLLPEEQPQVLMAISELLKPSGSAYFSVRRDLKRSGFRIHAKKGTSVYQCNVFLPYPSVIKAKHCEVYEYRHLNQRELDAAEECPFCSPSKNSELVTESAMAYAILDRYPVSLGHTLVIPKEHVADYFDLSFKSKTSCLFVMDRVKWLLDQQYKPNGYNIGINIGQEAGQTIPHVHIHVIPRYQGDVVDPVGGVRTVIPGKGNYLKKHIDIGGDIETE